VWSSGDRGRILDERLLEVANRRSTPPSSYAEVHATGAIEAAVRYARLPFQGRHAALQHAQLVGLPCSARIDRPSYTHHDFCRVPRLGYLRLSALSLCPTPDVQFDDRHRSALISRLLPPQRLHEERFLDMESILGLL